jgi:hypothetical protein
MLKIEIYGSINEEHKLVIQNRKKLLQELQECFPCEVIITIKKRGKRSTPQNNYYHVAVVETVRHRLIQLGHRITHEECHQELKHKFLKESLADEHGTVILEKGGSTTELNKTEFSDYIERIREWCLEMLEIDIPPATSDNSMAF